jgi:hypothetical protein
MKKISSILLALFMALTFSNTAIAGHSEESGGWWDWKDIWTNAPMYRCSIHYTRFNDRSTSVDYVRPTTQHRVRGDRCDWGYKKLAKKIIKWMEKSKHNIVIELDEFLYCRKRTSFQWDNYSQCGEKYRYDLVEMLMKKRPDQVDIDNIY